MFLIRVCKAGREGRVEGVEKGDFVEGNGKEFYLNSENLEKSFRNRKV